MPLLDFPWWWFWWWWWCYVTGLEKERSPDWEKKKHSPKNGGWQDLAIYHCHKTAEL